MLTDATGKSPFGPHADDLADLAPSESGRFSQIQSVTLASSTVRTDRVVAVTLACTGGHRRAIAVESLTPGFEVELLPERSQERGKVIVGIRVHRRLGTIRRLCLLKFRVGNASAVASITVLY